MLLVFCTALLCFVASNELPQLLYLQYGESITGGDFPLQTVSSRCPNLQVLVMQDATKGMENLTTTTANLLLELNLKSLGSSVGNTYGLVAFRDRPLSSKESHEDTCFSTNTNFQPSLPLIASRISELEIKGGGDAPNAQLKAILTYAKIWDQLIYAASPEVLINPQAPSPPPPLRIMVLVTGTTAHIGEAKRHNTSSALASSVIDYLDLSDVCDDKTYPTIEEVKVELTRRQIALVVVAATVEGKEEQATALNSFWSAFVRDLDQDFPKPPLLTMRTAEINEDTVVKERFLNQLEGALYDAANALCPQLTAPPLDVDAGILAHRKSSTLKEGRLEFLNRCLHSNALLAGKVLTAGDVTRPRYLQAIARYNLASPQAFPLAVVIAYDDLDVQAAIRCAAALEPPTPVVARSGSHDYAGYSMGTNDSLLIDLSKLNHIIVSPKTKTVRLGPGARLASVAIGLFTSGSSMLPTGACTSIGIGGHILGGGYGYYARAYGLMIDQVRSMKVVTSSGDILRVNGEGPFQDLFWGLRGGGSNNFGIVTDFEAELIDAPLVTTAASLIFPPNTLPTILKATVAFVDAMPRGLGFSLIASSTFVGVQAHYFGPYEDFVRVIAPFTARVPPYVTYHRQADFLTNFAELSIVNLLDTTSPVAVPPVRNSLLQRPRAPPFGVAPVAASGRKVDLVEDLWSEEVLEPAPLYFASFSLYLKEKDLSQGLYQILSRLNISSPNRFGVAIETLGGPSSEISAVNANATAYVHRDAIFLMHAYIKSVNPLRQSDLEFFEDLRTDLFAHVGNPQCYQNYKDPLFSRSKANEAYFGQNLERLESVKAKYDPRNLFVYPQSLTPIN